MRAGQLESKNKLRSRLCMVYHLCIHGEYEEAKDEFLCSRLSDSIPYQDS